MNQQPAPRSPRALTAIAAVLALSAIPAAQAQDVQPTAPTPALSLPQDATAASPGPATPATPTVTLPPETTTPMAAPDPATTAGTAPQASSSSVPAAPTVAVSAPDATTAAEPAPNRRVVRSAAARAAAPASEAGPAAPTVPTARDSGTAVDGALAEGAVPRAVAAPTPASGPSSGPASTPTQALASAEAEPAAPPADRSSGLPIGGVVGLLAALGVAGMGIAAMRRRRRTDPVYEEGDYAPEPLPSAGLPDLVPAPAPVITEPAPVIIERVSRPAAPDRVPAYASAGSATAVLAASSLPRTADERRELLDRMVDAAPDEDNPFTSRKGRMRRARIQLQHRELHEEASPALAAAPHSAFDFRTYRPSTPPTHGPAAPTRPDLIDA